MEVYVNASYNGNFFAERNFQGFHKFDSNREAREI